MSYHGPGSPGGVAHAFKVQPRPAAAWSGGLLRAPGDRGGDRVRRARRARRVRAGHSSGHRESVPRGPGLARTERGRALEAFVFRLGYRGRVTTLVVREGFVTEEFIDLARTEQRTPDEERRLDLLKREMAYSA